jgi:predicted amidohydrolase YtcJ
VKIFSDGSLGAETAALRVDGSEPPVSTGVLVHNDAGLRSMIQEARERGFRVEIHAIGDAAADQVLSAMEAAGVLPEERPVHLS